MGMRNPLHILFADPDLPKRVREELTGLDLDEVFARAHVVAEPRVFAA